jgi:hypothetical protein
LFQFIIAVIFHSYTIYGCVMQLLDRRDPHEFRRKSFTLVAVTVMCLVGIAMGISAGKIISKTRESRSPSETGRVTFLQVSTEGIVLLSSLLFSTISILLCYFLNWSKAEQGLICQSAQTLQPAL